MRPRVPWWKEEIKTSIINKNKSLKKFQSTHDLKDFILLKRLRTRTIFLVEQNEVSSWKAYKCSLDNHANPAVVWNKIKVKYFKGTN